MTDNPTARQRALEIKERRGLSSMVYDDIYFAIRYAEEVAQKEGLARGLARSTLDIATTSDELAALRQCADALSDDCAITIDPEGQMWWLEKRKVALKALAVARKQKIKDHG